MSVPYAEVIGDPIAQSKSPLIHNFWLKHAGLSGIYRKTRILSDALPEYFANRLTDGDWRGCNVTSPHKIAVADLVDRLDEQAAKVGAVNTVVKSGSGLTGYNTDVDGVLAALPPTLMNSDIRVCLIGAGGAARAAIAACALRKVRDLFVAARSGDTAQALLDEFQIDGRVGPLDDVSGILEADVVINATPLGMTGKPAIPQSVVKAIENSSGKVVFDMVYAPLETALLAAARRGGHQAVDGLSMLIGQAGRAFRLFFGADPLGDDALLRQTLLK